MSSLRWGREERKKKVSSLRWGREEREKKVSSLRWGREERERIIFFTHTKFPYSDILSRKLFCHDEI